MDWNDLPIDARSLNRLRNEFSLNRPEEVVRLAWGAGDLLRRVIGDDEILRIKEQCSFEGSLPFDSRGFSLGGQFGSPAVTSIPIADSFVEKRSSLLQRLERAKSPARRARLEGELEKLYSQTG